MDATLSRRTVLLIDDHPVVLESLCHRINGEEDLVVCGQARNAHDGLAAVARQQPDIIVVALALPDRSGLDLIKDIRAQSEAPIIVFTRYDDPGHALRALKAGANGYLTKHQTTADVVAAIRSVLKGERVLSRDLSRAVLALSLGNSSGALPEQCLADRELEIFELLGKGIGTREIAQRLGRSVKTIEAYRARIKTKLQLSNASELMREAVRWVEGRRP